MDDNLKYKRAWDMAMSKFKELCEIKSFHGLQYESRHMVTLEIVIEYMEESLQVASRKEGKQNEVSD